MLARVIVRKQSGGLALLESCNPVQLPASGNFFQESVAVNGGIKGNLPNPANYETRRGIEVGQTAVEAGVQRICVLPRTRAEAGGKIDSLGNGISGTKCDSFVQPSVRGHLKLIAIRKTVALVSEQFRGAGWESIGAGIGPCYRRAASVHASGEGASAIDVHGAKISLLLHFHTGNREVCLNAADEFPAQATDENGLNHGVAGGLPLETVVEIFRVGSAEMRESSESERNFRR